MPRRRFRPEEISGQVREPDVLLSQGQAVAEVTKALAISEVTHYWWCKEHGGIKVN